MRDYLSPARNYLGRAIVQVSALSKIAFKPRFVAMTVSTAAVAFFAASVVALRTMTASGTPNDNAVTTETKIVPGESSVTSTTSSTDTEPEQSEPAASGSASVQSSITQSSSSNSNDTQTSIVVNNQPIEVPKNGSTQTTITNTDGTTTNVSVNSSSNGSSFSSSSSFIHSNTNNGSNSSSVIINSP